MSSPLLFLLDLDTLSSESAFYKGGGATALIDRATFDEQGRPIRVALTVADNDYDYAEKMYFDGPNEPKPEPNPEPLPYVCSKCGVEGVKLWRQWNTMASDINLLCAMCASHDQEERLTDLDERGYHTDEWSSRSCLIGSLAPAVPTEEGDTYWGFTSVPDGPLNWWYSLPNFPLESHVDPPEPLDNPPSRFSQTFTVDDLPCPDCGQYRIIGYVFTNEADEHMHTHYVCTFWPSWLRPDSTYAWTKQCG